MASWGGTHARRRSDTPAGFGSSLPTERAAAAQTFQPPRAKPARSCSSCATELAEPRPPPHDSGARRRAPSGARRHTGAAPQQRRRRRRRLERELEEADPDSLVLPAEDAMELCTWLTEADPAHIRTVLTYYRWNVRRAVVGLLGGRYEQDLAAAQPPTPAATDDTADDSPSKLRRGVATSSTLSLDGEPPEGRRVALPARASRGRTLSSRPVALETSIVGGQHTRRWAVPFAHECEALFERFRLQPHSLRVAAAIKPPQFTDESVQPRRKSETPRWNASTRRPRTAWENSPKPEAEPQAKSRKRVDDGNAGTRATSRDAGGLGLAEVEALAASIWQDPPPPRGVIALALTAQDSVGDGWVRSPSALRLLLRYAAFFARHWEDKFEVVLRSAGPPQGEEGHRLLQKKDWVAGFVALVGKEGNIGEEAAAADAAFTARQQRGRSGVPFSDYCTWVAEKRVADAFVFGDTPRNSCYPAFTGVHRPICEPARELQQFLLWLGPLVPKMKPLKPWEFALADRHGHSGMIDQVEKWSARLEGRAVRAAEVRKDLACWAEAVLDEEARSMTPAARRRRKQQALDLARTRSQMTPQELAYAEGVAATKLVMASLFAKKVTTRKVLEQLARAPVGQPGGERALSLKVFIAALRQIGVTAETASDASLKRVFGSFDIDGNGTVTPSEFMTALREAEVVAEADKAAEEEEARLEQQAEREARQAAERAAERRRRDEEAAEALRLRLAREAEVAAKAVAKAEAKAARARAAPGAPAAASEATAGAGKSPAPLTVRNLLAGRVQ